MRSSEYIFSLYKPFRNQLRGYNLFDSLQLIWGYSRNFTFNLPLPDDIELPNGFNPSDDINDRRFKSIPEFEQEFLLKEIIINCHTLPIPSGFSLKRKDKLAKLIYYLRHTLNEKIDQKYNTQDDFLLEFNRMTHRQFGWQLSYNSNIILRYYKIYSEPAVDTIIKNKLQLNTFEIFVLGIYFFYLTGQLFKIDINYNSRISFITNEKIKIFFNHFAVPIEKAKEELKAYQQMNENIFYSYNPLLSKPILIYKNTLLCPLHLLIFWKMTSGIYYSIVKESGFENAFGNSFQKYIGEVIFRCHNKNPQLTILSEATYGREEKRTTDWIIYDGSAILFIECKTKRMTMVSKSEIDIKKGLEKDLDTMASAIVQLYKTYIDYRSNKYPQLIFDENKKFIPLIVTLEDWYININPRIMGLLKELVIEKMKESNLEIELIDCYPYHLRSSNDFEKDIQIINSLGILSYFDKANKNELHSITQNFNYTNTFEGEMEKIFVEPLKEANKNKSTALI